MRRIDLFNGDCLEMLKGLPDDSIDSIVTDPPYGLSKEPDMAEVLQHWLAGDDYQHQGSGFMGKSWDSFVPGPSVWKECLRVLKPGGHLLAFFGARTQDLGTLSIRLAGFEIRDSIAWMYGSGFPKNMDVSKQIDKMAGAEREILGTVDPRATYDGKKRNSAAINGNWRQAEGRVDTRDLSQKAITSPATEAAKQWEGWGTALKPAHEPITMARKPFKGSVTANVLANGTGALNIDACRIGNEVVGWGGGRGGSDDPTQSKGRNYRLGEGEPRPVEGRWPANLIHDGSDAVLALFPESSQTGKRSATSQAAVVDATNWGTSNHKSTEYTDSGSTARFFYCAKASSKDRHEGLDDPGPQFEHGGTLRKYENGAKAQQGNHHPTVKPTELMAYLCRLVTPAGGVVLDPFMGSGSTGKAAIREGFQFVGIEQNPGYVEIAIARIQHMLQQAEVNDANA